MAIPKEILDELLKDHSGPEDITGGNGLLKQLTKALIERAMQAEMTEELGYERNQKGEQPTTNRRNGSGNHRHSRPSGRAASQPSTGYGVSGCYPDSDSALTLSA